MGTRADFYIGRGTQAKWLGSVAYDGYLGDDRNPHPRGGKFAAVTSADEFEKAVEAWMVHDDAHGGSIRPADGWPWPWKDSCLTDYSYAWDDGAVWVTDHPNPRPRCSQCGNGMKVWRRLGDVEAAGRFAEFPIEGGAQEAKVSFAGDPARIQRIAAAKLITDEDLAAAGLERCGDNSCVFGAPGGMATNGGCRCDDRNEAERWPVSARHAFTRVARLARNIAADRRRLSEREAELLRMLADADTATLDARRAIAASQAVAPVGPVVAWQDEPGFSAASIGPVLLIVRTSRADLCGRWEFNLLGRAILHGYADSLDAAKAAAIAAARTWRDSIRL